MYSIQHYVISFQWLAAGRWFSPGIPVSSTNKTDRHYIAEILLKAVFSTVNPLFSWSKSRLLISSDSRCVWSGETFLLSDCCFNEFLALKSRSTFWTNTNQISPSYHQKVTHVLTMLQVKSNSFSPCYRWKVTHVLTMLQVKSNSFPPCYRWKVTHVLAMLQVKSNSFSPSYRWKVTRSHHVTGEK